MKETPLEGDQFLVILKVRKESGRETVEVLRVRTMQGKAIKVKVGM